MRNRVPRAAGVAAVLLSLLLLSCRSNQIPVSTTFDPLAPFPAEGRYTWDTARNRMPDDSRLQRLDLDRILRQVVDEEMLNRGWTVTTPEDAAYRMSYDLEIHNWIASDRTRSIGSLSLNLEEAVGGHRVWGGFARAEVHVGMVESDRAERLRRAIARMLRNFPPNQ